MADRHAYDRHFAEAERSGGGHRPPPTQHLGTLEFYVSWAGEHHLPSTLANLMDRAGVEMSPACVEGAA